MRKHASFFNRFSSNFRETSTKNHAKRVKTILVHKNRQKITRGTLLFSKNNDFFEIFGVPLGPQGASGTTREIAKNAHFSRSWSIARESDGGRPLVGLGKAPKAPPGALSVRFCVDLWIRFAHQKQAKKRKKCLK